MNQLVLLRDGQAITNSIIVHETFGKRHDHVLRDIEKFEKDVPNFGEMFKPSFEYDAYGRKRKIYEMNRDGWVLLVMGFTGEKAMKFKLRYIKEFNEMEAELNKPKEGMLVLPQDYKSALVALVEQVERTEQLAATVEEQKPKVEYHDTVLKKKGFITATDVAKDLGMSAAALNGLLHEYGVQFKKSGCWYLYAKYDHLITEGIADYHINEWGQTLKWSEEGRKWIIDLISRKRAEQKRMELSV